MGGGWDTLGPRADYYIGESMCDMSTQTDDPFCVRFEDRHCNDTSTQTEIDMTNTAVIEDPFFLCEHSCAVLLNAIDQKSLAILTRMKDITLAMRYRDICDPPCTTIDIASNAVDACHPCSEQVSDVSLGVDAEVPADLSKARHDISALLRVLDDRNFAAELMVSEVFGMWISERVVNFELAFCDELDRWD